MATKNVTKRVTRRRDRKNIEKGKIKKWLFFYNSLADFDTPLESGEPCLMLMIFLLINNSYKENIMTLIEFL